MQSTLPPAIFMVALLAAALVGIAFCGPATVEAPWPLTFGLAAPTVRLDPLASWFLGVFGVVTLCIVPSLPPYLEHIRRHADLRRFHVGMPLLLASMAGVVMAANAQTFLVCWEIMSLSSFVLVLTDSHARSTRQAALVYLGATRVGTAFLMAGFLWAFALTGEWSLAAWQLRGAAALGPGALVLVGLLVKAGCWPFHLWLPLAHPEAPAPVSAVMSGLMVKVAICAVIRLFVLSPAFDHPWFGYALMVLGAASALWGVLFAILQQDLKRLLAYSTVENIGLILMALGLSVTARHDALVVVSSLALAAALFHVANHAFFKSLLFLGAGAIDQATGLRDMERLGGLAKGMPVTFLAFLTASAAICALPPLNGFASEWLLYQSLVGLASAPVLPLHRFLAMLGCGWIALVGAIVVGCFLKVCGVVFLGQPRSIRAARVHETPRGMRISLTALAVGCVLLGLGAPLVLGRLQSVVAGGVGSAWVLPYPALLLALLAFGLVARRLANPPVRVYSTWDCGFGPPTARMQTTSTSFAQPVARLFGALYHYVVQRRGEGRDRHHFPEEVTAQPAIRSMLASRVYLPVLRFIDRVAERLVRLQAGSIHLYLLTMFVTLWILLIVGARFR